MPLLSPDQLLDNVRINELVLDASTRFNETLPLRFIDRLKPVPADDNEITATYTERVFAADIVADDQAAAVYGGGQLQFVTNVLPNIKMGRRLSQGVISRLNRLRASLGTEADQAVFTNWETTTANNLLRGVREQMNALACAMMIDSYSYNRNGVQFTGSWGMPSNLKVTPGTLWTNASATPITDTLTLKQLAANTYGIVYDRFTISTADFVNMVATTEFKNLIAGLVNAPLGSATGAFNTRDVRMPGFASQLLGMDVEIDDKLYYRQNTDGSIATAARVLPLGKVLLSRKEDDRNAVMWDWGNAVVTESLVAGLVGSPGNFPAGERYGPFAYWTGRADLNPPDVTAWCVARGFPRRFNIWNTGVLTVQ